MSCQTTQDNVHKDLYQPIDESSFRILRLLPGKFTDEIQCVLEIRSFSVTTRYEALSYQWGNESITQSILVASVGSRMSTKWPWLETAVMALERLSEAIQSYLTPYYVHLWILTWAMGTGFDWYLTSLLHVDLLLWGPEFVPAGVRMVGNTAMKGALYAALAWFLFSTICAIDRKFLSSVLDLLFGFARHKRPARFNTLQITTNLASALRYLRDEKKIRTLWIDALCIDQKNEDEKIMQIKHMDRIYANAISTLVWLGGYHGLEEPERCGERGSDDCEHRRLIQSAFNYVSLFSWWRVLILWYFGHLLWFFDHLERSRFLVSRKGIIELAKRGWWERLWVVQEVSLSTSRVYIMCGHDSCEFRHFRDTWYFLSKKHRELKEDLLPSQEMLLTIEVFRYSSFQNNSTPWRKDYRHQSLESSYESSPSRPFHDLPFADRLQCLLLQNSGRFKCRDDRDRLYAVLGIAGGVEVGKRRIMAMYMERLAEGPSGALDLLVVPFLFPFKLSAVIAIFFTKWLLSFIWSTYCVPVIQYWTISRHEYAISRNKRVLDALMGKDTSRTEFFTTLAGYLAKGTGNLSFLDAASCFQDPEDTMPSWVPDWTREVSLRVALGYPYRRKRRRQADVFRITDFGKVLHVLGHCRTITNVIRTADLEKLQSSSPWQRAFKGIVALTSRDRTTMIRLLSSLGRLVSPEYRNKLERADKRHVLSLFFQIIRGFRMGLGYLKSDNIKVYTNNAMAEGMGCLTTGKVEKGDRLLRVPGCSCHLVLQQGKVAFRWRVVGLVDMDDREDWEHLDRNGKLQEVAIE